MSVTEPLTLIEIDLPQCTREFGVAPCTATLSARVPCKCYRTPGTCYDLPNYDEGVQTVVYAQKISDLPVGLNLYPALASVSSDPLELNLSGIDPLSGPLGKRARCEVGLQNFPDADLRMDPYAAERKSGAAQFSGVGYDPGSRGTHFGRLLARHPYNIGLPARRRTGVVGQAPEDMRTEHYVTSEWQGPDAGGNLQLSLLDVLDLVDNAAAVVPSASSGVLAAGLTATALVATLAPEGIGDAEYAASGRICIGSEVMTFARSGDVLSLTGRGVDGTTAASHAEGDSVQLCWRVEGLEVHEAIAALLATQGIEGDRVPIADWAEETAGWLTGLRVERTICAPTGVARLLGELCQLGVQLWPDIRSDVIRLRVNRPLRPGEAPVDLTDEAHIIEGTPLVTRLPEKRVSEMQLYYGQISAANTSDSPAAFSRLAVAVANPNHYRTESIKVIYSRWLNGPGVDMWAQATVERLVARYAMVPQKFAAQCDIKDADNLQAGALVRVTSYVIEDADGSVPGWPGQVSRVELGSGRVAVEVESYDFSGRYWWWLPDGAPDYDAASAEERQFGAFYVETADDVFADGTGPYLWF